MPDDQTEIVLMNLRLECLKLANNGCAGWPPVKIIERANAYYSYITSMDKGEA